MNYAALTIAQNSPTFTPGELATFLGILLFICGLVIAVRKAFGHDPALHKQYVSKQDHDQFRTETLAELKRHASRRAEIYDMQTEHGEKISALQTSTDAQTRDLGELKRQITATADRIDAVPERTIRLLRETQQLHTAPRSASRL